MNIAQDYRAASIKTADNLKTIARAITTRELAPPDPPRNRAKQEDIQELRQITMSSRETRLDSG